MLSIKVHGNADHGWIGEVHDGDTHKVYNPQGADVKAALGDMLSDHFEDHKPAEVAAPPAPVTTTADDKKNEQAAAAARIKAQVDANAAKAAAAAKPAEVDDKKTP